MARVINVTAKRKLKMHFGCDPGLTGAVVVFDDNNNYVNHFSMPTVKKDGAPVVTKRIDSGELIKNLQRFFNITDVNTFEKQPIVYLEHPTVIPANGPVRIASLNHSIGVIEGIFTALCVRVIYVTPQQWKKSFNLIGKNKKESILIALELVPEFGKLLIREADIAEAALIGIYGNKYIKPTLKGDL